MKYCDLEVDQTIGEGVTLQTRVGQQDPSEILELTSPLFLSINLKSKEGEVSANTSDRQCFFRIASGFWLNDDTWMKCITLPGTWLECMHFLILIVQP